MKKYDREILVPYLRDVCCMELLCAGLERRAGWLGAVEKREDLYALGGCFLLSFAAALVFSWLDLYFLKTFFKIAAVAFLASFLILLALKLTEGKRRRDRALALSARHLRSARQLRAQLYQVGILPVHFRNVSAVCQLYDLLSRTDEEDLDAALPIIRPGEALYFREEALLRRRFQTAREDGELRRMQEIAAAEPDRERQRTYGAMIAGVKNVTDFILGVEYLWNQ